MAYLVLFFAVILLSPSATFIQNASAVLPVAQITSAKSDGVDLPNGSTAIIPSGQGKAKLTFEYRGFDDNDHIVELQCSWDGINYQKSTCSSESAESRVTFTGPDGVSRAYFVKTGMASREIAMPPIPKIFTFSVKVINDNPDSVPPAIWKFRVKSSDGGGAGGPANGTGVIPTKVTVKFDSITILEDHDGPAYNPDDPQTNVPGKWVLWAYVQGKQIRLFAGDVYAGKTINFKPGTEVTITKPTDNLPLSIFTIGIEHDCDTLLDFLTNPIPGFHSPGDWSKEITDLFTNLYSNPNLDWKDEINAIQYKIGGYSIDSDCYDPSNRLGTINELYSPPNYKPVYTYTPEMLGNITEPLRTHILNFLTHPSESTYVMSSLKDFILKYTVTVAP